MTVTLNPSDTTADITLSNGNLTATFTKSVYPAAVRATVGFSTGKLYFEWQLGGALPSNCNAGFASASESLIGVGGSANSVHANTEYNQVQFNNTTLGGWLVSSSSGDWCACAIDIDNALIWYKELGSGGNWNNSGTANPATGSGGFSVAGLTNLPWYPELDFYAQGNSISTVNFGATAFSGTIPSGFTSVYAAAGGGGAPVNSRTLMGVGLRETFQATTRGLLEPVRQLWKPKRPKLIVPGFAF